MPRRSDNQHVETAPHFDGKQENIINDPTASAGSMMGVQNETKEEFARENPFHYTPKEDPEMKEFEKLMRGNIVKNK
ncbi:hypothetical protein [Paenisporosarcina indica]|uniref:hypothetical protein n=1 Tax=Paenisporosarcina indica TaxID=650093 RepID=UPI00094F6BE9|nr:hypothetical protein [Paenisporosarcina indica]